MYRKSDEDTPIYFSSSAHAIFQEEWLRLAAKKSLEETEEATLLRSQRETEQKKRETIVAVERAVVQLRDQDRSELEKSKEYHHNLSLQINRVLSEQSPNLGVPTLTDPPLRRASVIGVDVSSSLISHAPPSPSLAPNPFNPGCNPFVSSDGGIVRAKSLGHAALGSITRSIPPSTLLSPVSKVLSTDPFTNPGTFSNPGMRMPSEHSTVASPVMVAPLACEDGRGRTVSTVSNDELLRKKVSNIL